MLLKLSGGGDCKIIFKKIHNTREVWGFDKNNIWRLKPIATIDTECVMFVNDEEIGRGLASQHPGDKYNKITGKKYALIRSMCTEKIIGKNKKTNKPIIERTWHVAEKNRKLIWAKFVERLITKC